MIQSANGTHGRTRTPPPVAILYTGHFASTDLSTRTRSRLPVWPPSLDVQHLVFADQEVRRETAAAATEVVPLLLLPLPLPLWWLHDKVGLLSVRGARQRSALTRPPRWTMQGRAEHDTHSRMRRSSLRFTACMSCPDLIAFAKSAARWSVSFAFRIYT